MNARPYTSQAINSYLRKFQESQFNLNALIREERIQKRIERSRKRLTTANG